MTLSVMAAMLSDGFTPGLAEMALPSQTYMFLYPKTRWSESITPELASFPIPHSPRICAVVGVPVRASVNMTKGFPSTTSEVTSASSLANGMKEEGGIPDDMADLRFNKPFLKLRVLSRCCMNKRITDSFAKSLLV